MREDNRLPPLNIQVTGERGPIFHPKEPSDADAT